MSSSDKRSETRHGGRHQRARLEESAAATDAPPRQSTRRHYNSDLVNFVLNQWAWGHLSAPLVQRYCLKYYMDQLKLLQSVNISPDNIDASLHDLARLGTWGKHPQNIHSELLRWLGVPSAPAYFRCKLPVIKMKGDGTASKTAVLENFPIFLPHEIFSWYFHNDRQRFDKLFLGGTTSLERKQFWR